MNVECPHEWVRQWFAVSARLARADEPPIYAVTHVQLEQCNRCHSLQSDDIAIAARAFHTDASLVSEVILRREVTPTLP